jgi:diadenosine tetraphosphate (Ap4A) HIT family hydrolase
VDDLEDEPGFLARLLAGFAVMGDAQFLPGYSLLIPNDGDALRLSDLPRASRLEYLTSLDQLAEAVELACKQSDPAFRRVNIEILGNSDPHLHAHVWPRYDWEDAERVTWPVWNYPEDRWHDPSTALGSQHDALREAIKEQLKQLAR